MKPDPGVSCVEVDGLTVISIKPFSLMDALVAFVLGGVFIGIAFFMFHSGGAPMMFIGISLGSMFLLAVLVPAYMMFFTADVFVVNRDNLEKRWSCKPFHWRSHIPRGEIQSVQAIFQWVRTAKGSRAQKYLLLTKTNGHTIRLINGGEIGRLRQVSDYLNKALFPNVLQTPSDQAAPVMMSGKVIKPANWVALAVIFLVFMAIMAVPFGMFLIVNHAKNSAISNNLTSQSVVTPTPVVPPAPPGGPRTSTVASIARGLPADIDVAWEKAGAQSGWMDPGGQLIIMAKGRRGQIPAFHFTQWTPGAISQLAAPDQSFGLDLRGTRITDADLNDLAGFKQLQVLNLNSTHITGAGLTALAGLPFLESLDLRGSRVTDAGLQALAGLTQLQALDLSGTHVTDAGLTGLGSLTQLHSLDLANTRITDASLKELASLTQLKVLWLDHSSVTDAGLLDLEGLTQLRTLSLRNTAVTNAGVMALQNALHKVRVFH
jgi:Leucine rich repeat